MFPSFIFPWMEVMSGSTTNWDSDLNFGTSHDSTFLFNRIKNFGKNFLLTQKFYSGYTKTMEKSIEKNFGKKISVPETYFKRNQLIFLNSHSSMGVPKASSPQIVEVGGMHMNVPKKLPDELENFMNSAENGVVYFSLGSVIQGEKLPQGVIQAILNVFGRMKYKILWKWSDKMENATSNIKFSKWLPQQDVLRKNFFSLTL